ncbi:MAG: pyruvate, phosphate dikinase [Marinilabiliaceae bacterium]|nr:pyruvate, phosphate dikinase [Marinilabiliaceae bacterium]
MNHRFDYIQLSQVFNHRRSDKDIFHELMPFKVKELLLVATYYDSYSIVREGRFFDRIFGEFLQLNLYSAPRITSVSSHNEALIKLDQVTFDMIIIMVGIDLDKPMELAYDIYIRNPDIPILFLLNNNRDLRYFHENNPATNFIERVFVWNGDSRVFLAMIKYVEDKKNVIVDTEVGDVRVILLVEDSQRYYSRYLPLLYSILMTQTQNVMEEETNDHIHKMLKVRVRPKILLVSTFDEAVEVVDKYLDNLICVISDVKYLKDRLYDDNAGVELIKYVNSKVSIPCLLQSTDLVNAYKARALGAAFVDKNSESLSLDIQEFVYKHLGFGEFEFLNLAGDIIAKASNLKEFFLQIAKVPDESLMLHAGENGISTWLMARGEINLAKQLRPYKIEDFKSPDELRQTILLLSEKMELDRIRGGVIQFDPKLLKSNRFIQRIGIGSFGGKGRGISFLSHFIESIDFENIIPELDICIPPTSIIGSGEYQRFLEYNNLMDLVFDLTNYDQIKQLFLTCSLPLDMMEQLKLYLEVMQKPLAIRSSGLFEDSLLQPFSGVYSTYLLPNNHPDIEVRVSQLSEAVRMVYASIFSEGARSYFNAVNYKIEEERMAVIIQELVGHSFDGLYYPNISGVAQSFNYYPFSYMQPEDGFAVIGVGLGKYVVGGEKAFRFCPKFPKLELNALPDQIKDSQTHFYALDLNNTAFMPGVDGEDANVKFISIREAENHGNLKHCAVVYDFCTDRLVSDFSVRGPRVVNFANLLKYDFLPIADALHLLLRFLREAMGTPVEIEFSIDLTCSDNYKPRLYLLQVKPLIRCEQFSNVSFDEVVDELLILKSLKGMGNGRIDTIYDVIFMDLDRFDKTKTQVMADEIAYLNEKMKCENREYILIGPGRWGTRDRFTGIPVLWANISNAKVIVEMGLEGFPLEASLGSHFFHNVTSMNIGYFSVHHKSENDFVNMDCLNDQEIIEETTYFKHIRFIEPLVVLMDGKEQKAVVMRSL